jgi:hypothetical protein
MRSAGKATDPNSSPTIDALGACPFDQDRVLDAILIPMPNPEPGCPIAGQLGG